MVTKHEHKDFCLRTALMLILFAFMLAGFNTNNHSDDFQTANDRFAKTEVLMSTNNAILVVPPVLPTEHTQLNSIASGDNTTNKPVFLAHVNRSSSILHQHLQETYLNLKPTLEKNISLCIFNFQSDTDLPAIS